MRLPILTGFENKGIKGKYHRERKNEPVLGRREQLNVDFDGGGGWSLNRGQTRETVGTREFWKRTGTRMGDPQHLKIPTPCPTRLNIDRCINLRQIPKSSRLHILQPAEIEMLANIFILVMNHLEFSLQPRADKRIVIASSVK